MEYGYANHMGYSDVTPYEIIRKISDKTLEVREMQATITNREELIFIPGGFSAHCPNQFNQEWDIKPDESRPIIRIRLNKKGWQDKHGHKFTLAIKPQKFYDFNF